MEGRRYLSSKVEKGRAHLTGPQWTKPNSAVAVLPAGICFKEFHLFISNSDLQGVGDRSVNHTWVLLLYMWKVFPLNPIGLCEWSYQFVCV